jgi:hypothetical protein
MSTSAHATRRWCRLVAWRGCTQRGFSSEQASTLMPWLRQHPIKGWLLHDPSGQTGKAYGLEMPETVFIGADGKLVGFKGIGIGSPPQDSEVEAALEGRISTTRPTSAAMMKAIQASGKLRLNAESVRFVFQDPTSSNRSFPRPMRCTPRHPRDRRPKAK